MDIEEIRKKKLAELQSQAEEQKQLQEQAHQVEDFAKRWLSREALQRFGALKQAHPEKALLFCAAITNGVQSGQIKDQISDEFMKEILKQMDPEKRETKIRRI